MLLGTDCGQCGEFGERPLPGSAEWARRFFATVDGRNTPTTTGHEAARAGFAINSTQAIRHDITGIWHGVTAQGATVVSVEAQVTYTLPGNQPSSRASSK